MVFFPGLVSIMIDLGEKDRYPLREAVLVLLSSLYPVSWPLTCLPSSLNACTNLTNKNCLSRCTMRLI